MAYDVFISHSTKDKPYADAVCANLEARGIRCWIAPRDVLPGISWTEAIVNAVEDSSVFLLILTTNSNNSKQTIKEVDCAVNHNKTIIPFRLEDIKPTGSMEYFLGNLHWLDALTPHLEEHIQKLGDYILKIIEANKVKDQKSSAPALVATDFKQEPDSTKLKETPKTQPEKAKPFNWLRVAIIAGVLVIAGIVTTVFLLNGKKPAVTADSPTAVVVQTSTASAVAPTTTPTQEPTATQTPAPTALPAVVEPTATPTEALGIGSTHASIKDGMTQVYIPAGVFTMGSEFGQSDEKPVNQVELSAFWIDTTEVTNAMYNKCVRDGVCTKPSHLSSATIPDYYTNSKYADFPVIQVSYADANKYCEWAGRRLPTEAEWEKAARGTEANNYPWGNTTPGCSLVNYGGCHGDTVKVGTTLKNVSVYGALDMAGNVLEWVSDWYQQNYYDFSPLLNPTGPESGSFRIVRGGAWDSNENGIRLSNRTQLNPNNLSNDVGFRCALPAN